MRAWRGRKSRAFQRLPEAEKRKLAARRKLNNALSRAEIRRAPCEVCGEVDRVEPYLHDTERPLYVVWLCPPDRGLVAMALESTDDLDEAVQRVREVARSPWSEQDEKTAAEAHA